MQAVVHFADVQDRDGGALLLSTLLGRFPYLEKLFADSAYQGRTSTSQPAYSFALELLVRVTPPPLVILTVHDLCLAWMQHQSAFSKPSLKFRLQLLSLTLTAAMTNSIIGVAFKRNLRMEFGHPPIEHIVQKEVCQQG